MTAASDRDRILVARVGAAHGVRGEVRVKAFTAVPGDIAAYCPLATADGRVLTVGALRPAAGGSADMLVVRFAGIDRREDAEALNGTELFVPRDRLPPAAEDEFYHADLIGLAALTAAGEPVGTVVAVHDFGAGDILEIAPARGPTVLIPFSRAAVPEVDIAAGRLTVVPPADDGDDGEEPAP